MGVRVDSLSSRWRALVIVPTVTALLSSGLMAPAEGAVPAAAVTSPAAANVDGPIGQQELGDLSKDIVKETPGQRRATLKAHGYPTVGLLGSQISKKGVVSAIIYTHAYRNNLRSKKALRHAGSQPDVLSMSLQVLRNPQQAANVVGSPSDLETVQTIERKVTRDGVIFQQFRLPRATAADRALAAQLFRATPQERQQRLRVAFLHSKDTVASKPGYETVMGSSLDGSMLAPVKKTPKSPKLSFVPMPVRVQRDFLRTADRQLGKKVNSKLRMTYFQEPLWNNPTQQGFIMSGHDEALKLMKYAGKTSNILLGKVMFHNQYDPANRKQISPLWFVGSGIKFFKANLNVLKTVSKDLGELIYHFFGGRKRGEYLLNTNGYAWQTDGHGTSAGGNGTGTCSDDTCKYVNRTFGLTIKNNTPFTLALDYQPLSCVWGTPVHAEGTKLAPGATYIDAGFLPVMSGVYRAPIKDEFKKNLETLAKREMDTAFDVYNNYQKNPSNFTYEPSTATLGKGEGEGAGGSLLKEETAPAAILGPKKLSFTSILSDSWDFIYDKIEPWKDSSCISKGIGHLWSVAATVTTVPQTTPAGQGPQTWNSNGVAWPLPPVRQVPVGVNNLPVPRAWGAPTDAYIRAHAGLSTTAVWNWNWGRPNNGPVSGAKLEGQTGSANYQGGLVQTIDKSTGTLNISFLGNDQVDYGPVPSSAGDNIAETMRASVKPGSFDHEGGVEITCHPGKWNLVTPWTAAGKGKGSAQAADIDMRSLLLKDVGGVTAALDTGFDVEFVAFDKKWNQLYAPGFEGVAASADATPQFANVLINSVSGSISAEDLNNLRTESGKKSTAAYFGCQFVGQASMPQGAVFDPHIMKSAVSGNNMQWYSLPYTVIGDMHGGPKMLTRPTIANDWEPADDAPSSATRLIGSVGTWRNAHSLQYFWFDCGFDKTCSQGAAAVGNGNYVFGDRFTPPPPSRDPIDSSTAYKGHWTPGNYYTFVVVAKDLAGRTTTAFAEPQQIIDRTLSAQSEGQLDCSADPCAIESRWFATTEAQGRTKSNTYQIQYQNADPSCENTLEATCWTTQKTVTVTDFPSTGSPLIIKQTHRAYGDTTKGRALIIGSTAGFPEQERQITNEVPKMAWR